MRVRCLARAWSGLCCCLPQGLTKAAPTPSSTECSGSWAGGVPCQCVSACATRRRLCDLSCRCPVYGVHWRLFRLRRLPRSVCGAGGVGVCGWEGVGGGVWGGGVWGWGWGELWGGGGGVVEARRGSFRRGGGHIDRRGLVVRRRLLAIRRRRQILGRRGLALAGGGYVPLVEPTVLEGRPRARQRWLAGNRVLWPCPRGEGV